MFHKIIFENETAWQIIERIFYQTLQETHRGGAGPTTASTDNTTIADIHDDSRIYLVKFTLTALLGAGFLFQSFQKYSYPSATLLVVEDGSTTADACEAHASFLVIQGLVLYVIYFDIHEM